ncbi:peroxide stress protein YaaA [Mediannikoviicoccus vaginalis]|uniref:peroxide stress protein YaaA n=1 Tax=Mediannikoviicoccus vaginalis TaxID=2899727 RepID=UPI001F38722E|nr:peroxide stress protein YaaA [Mediannikoviicoccus vaginalis]
MKIIFSPSKEMAFNRPIEEKTEFNEKTKIIIDELKKLKEEEIREIYKISDKVAKEVLMYIEDFEKSESYRAIEMYNGLAFRSFDVTSLKEDERKYMDEHLKILSTFYGPLCPEKLVRPYRLDFNTKLKVNGESLKNFWKEEYNKAFNKEEVILNLASNEFSSLLDRNKFKMYDFEFFERREGKLKQHSTTSKKARGAMLNYICRNKIANLEEIKLFDVDGYKYDDELSDKGQFVFVK